MCYMDGGLQSIALPRLQAVSEKEKGVADSRNMVQTLVMGMKSLLYSLSSFGNTLQVRRQIHTSEQTSTGISL